MRTSSPGAGLAGANLTPEMIGGRLVEKFAFGLPGVPAGLTPSSDSGEPAQFCGRALSANGLIRSSDAEYPSGPMGHGGFSLYFTLSTILPRASESSMRSPWLLTDWSNAPFAGKPQASLKR